MDELVRNGVSFSGHERNCVYLNTRRGRFANISAVSGLDFVDDARAHGLVDWDHDGDLDLWTANRTAPQLRFLRNDITGANHFVALRLRGKTCNRDAIGARVEIVAKGQPEQTLARALRAGEGFLGQSSKWLHFGLGKETTITKLTIYWPGDIDPQVFTDVEPNRFYLAEQHEPRLQLVPINLQSHLQPSTIETGTRLFSERVPLSSRIPLPALEYRTFADETASTSRWYGAPLLINLWASWCQPCLGELKLLAKEHKRIERSGLKVIALSVDGTAVSSSSSVQRAKEILAEIEFPFESGIASEKTIDILQYLSDLRFSQHRALPLPCSVLVTPNARIAIIYRGVVNIDDLVSDVTRISLSDEDWSRAALPFSGRWSKIPRRPNELVIPLYLIRQGYVDETRSIVNRFDHLLSTDREYPRLLVWLGDELFKNDQPRDGLRQYERALKYDPNYVPAMNNLSWKLASYHEAEIRDGAKALFWANRAATATNHKNPAVLDTLAAAFAETGRFSEAIATLEVALRLAQQEQQADLVQSIKHNLRKYRNRTLPSQD